MLFVDDPCFVGTFVKLNCFSINFNPPHYVLCMEVLSFYGQYDGMRWTDHKPYNIYR